MLILTGRELFGQFHFGAFSELYGSDSQMARGMFMRSEIRDLCEFTQRLYLGLPSSHDVRQAKIRKRIVKKQAKALKNAVVATNEPWEEGSPVVANFRGQFSGLIL